MASNRKVVIGLEQVPAGYVPLSEYGSPDSKRGKLGTPEYNAISSAWSAGKIPGVKLMRSPSDRGGPVYIDPSWVPHILEAARGRREAVEVVEVEEVDVEEVDVESPESSDSLTTIAADIASIRELLERLVAVAEQQKEYV